MKRICSLLALLLLMQFSLHAQRVEAEAVLSKKEIVIGEQIKLNLKLHYREGSQKAVVKWPEVSDTLTQGVEKISADSLKNTLVDRGSVTYEQAQAFTITSFDSGVYQIPSFQFIVDQDTVYSEPVELKVSTIPVDTTLPIHDIKDIAEVPPPPANTDAYKWGFLVGYIIGISIGLGLLIWLIVSIVRKVNNRPKQLMVLERKLLPHERALEALQYLRLTRPWENGQIKSYHSDLAQILREYIAQRWHINALEQTTYQLVRSLRDVKADETQILYLQRVLLIADLVKFAKEIPTKEENEVSLNLATQFVERTIPILPNTQPTQA